MQNTETSMTAMDAIYHRHAVRDYLPEKLDRKIIQGLLEAAVHAPTAMHEEPWSFVIIQNQHVLDRLSQDSKELILSQQHSKIAKHLLEIAGSKDFHIFYNASTLIVIYSKFEGTFVTADCWLAAQNLMLAACAQGLGSCVIGLAVAALNTPKWKAELGVASEMTAIAPVIIGIPAGATPAVPRKQPEIVTWK